MLAPDDEFEIGPIFRIAALTARTPEERKRHRAGIDGFECACQIGDELVGAGKADLGVAHAKGRHVLEQQDRVGH